MERVTKTSSVSLLAELTTYAPYAVSANTQWEMPTAYVKITA